jgi:group II intron reverse transcriptase/maturase
MATDLLSRLLTRSTLYRAFQRVWENGGCRGADGVTVGDFRDRLEWEIDSLQDSLLRRAYQPLPLLRFSVPKASGSGERYLSVPTVRDRVLQSAVYLVTKDLFEAEFEDSSFAYRQGRSVRQAVGRLRELRDAGYRWLLDADVAGFFDRIPHAPLLARLATLGLPPYVEHLFALWVESEVYDGRSVRRLTQGIPQGSVVSPMLANLYLDRLDEQLAAAGLVAVRYADDFAVLCRSEPAAEAALEVTDDLLEALELDLNREKTEIRSFDQGFKFLGALFVGDSVFLPLERAKDRDFTPRLPPPLNLQTYLELRQSPAAPAALPAGEE